MKKRFLLLSSKRTSIVKSVIKFKLEFYEKEKRSACWNDLKKKLLSDLKEEGLDREEIREAINLAYIEWGRLSRIR
jgi:hypothetical protein